MNYCLDSSALIDLHRRYPEDVFPAVWLWLDRLVREGRVWTCREVLTEVGRGDDQLEPWLKARQEIVVDLEPDVRAALIHVMGECPGLHDPRSRRDEADPVVVALALARDMTVVHLETRSSIPDAKPKIPDACRKLGVRATTPLAMMRAEKFRT